MSKPSYRIVFNRIPEIRKGVRRELRRVVDQTARAIEANAKAAILDPNKTGRIYRRETEVSFSTKAGGSVSFTAHKGSRTEHQASAPGEAPANDTSYLANSIVSGMVGELEAAVDVMAEYGPDLEHGTTKMAARPFLGPAVEKERFPFRAAVEGAIVRGSKA